ncbi:hypothetical protein JYU34_017944 [Plutella xylostella]|uniref:Uncharacterized protein n=1 Tax=Plutella xylostella TaxID=51655 RepID=A0ABQ7PZD8_PLUXY|nr:hypothetical protein JYU34_017944 [Plutella xylostella]
MHIMQEFGQGSKLAGYRQQQGPRLTECGLREGDPCTGAGRPRENPCLRVPHTQACCETGLHRSSRTNPETVLHALRV